MSSNPPSASLEIQDEPPRRFKLRRAWNLPSESDLVMNFEDNEQAWLGGNNLESSTPLWQHNRTWIRLPALAIKIAQLSFSATGFRGKIVAAVWSVSLITYGVIEKPGIRFLVSWAALCFGGLLFSFSVEQYSCPRLNIDKLWMIYSSLPPLLFLILSTALINTSLASSFLLGHILATGLLAPALSTLSSLRTLSTLSGDLAHLPPGTQMTGAMSLGLTGILGLVATVNRSADASSAFPGSAKIVLRFIALLVISLLLCLSMLFRIRTHNNLWDPEQTPRDDSVEMEHKRRAQCMTSTTIGFTFVFATFVMIMGSYTIISDSKHHYSNLNTSQDVFSVVILPVLANNHVLLLHTAGNPIAQMDWAMQLYYVVGTETAYVMASVLLLVSIFSTAHVPFESSPVDLIFLAVASIASHQVLTKHGRLTYLHGGLCLGLYLIVTFAILLAHPTYNHNP